MMQSTPQTVNVGKKVWHCRFCLLIPAATQCADNPLCRPACDNPLERREVA
jgi:hypothetical protein